MFDFYVFNYVFYHLKHIVEKPISAIALAQNS